MIEFRRVTKAVTQGRSVVTALDGIDLTISENEMFGIVGESGSGKSTLLRLINHLEAPTSGAVLVGGENLEVLPPRQLCRARSGASRVNDLLARLSEYRAEILTSILETGYMIGNSRLAALLVGLPLGTMLYLARPGGPYERRWLHSALNAYVNVVRPVPFLLFVVMLIRGRAPWWPAPSTSGRDDRAPAPGRTPPGSTHAPPRLDRAAPQPPERDPPGRRRHGPRWHRRPRPRGLRRGRLWSFGSGRQRGRRGDRHQGRLSSPADERRGHHGRDGPEAEGCTIELVQVSDNVQYNRLLADGEVDASFARHEPCMTTFNEENGTNLVKLASIHDAKVGLTPADALLLEETVDQRFAISLAARADDQDSEKIPVLRRAMTSDTVRSFLEEEHSETRLPAF